MAELLTQERLQPSLLDRLTDHEPGRPVESREQRVLSMARLRESVLRDVGWLFNTVHMQATTPLDEYPEVALSVLNFGVPDLTGTHVLGRDLEALEQDMTIALNRFEPRILSQSMAVSVEHRAEESNRRALAFTISGQLWAQPVPQTLYLKTELDLETGAVTIADQTR